MALLHVFFASIGSVIVLFILTKIMGNQEISQLTMFDYVNGITIGSIAAEMATSLETDFLKPLLAMCIYTAISLLVTFLSMRSLKMRRFLYGKTLVLLYDGKLYEKNLKRAKMDLGEFLAQCRTSGYFNIANLQAAFLEPNGKISFLPKATQRPVNPEDLNLSPQQETPTINIILDGQVLWDNLKYLGLNETWLEKQLHSQGSFKESDVFLATCDGQNNLSIYPKLNKPATRDVFE